MLSGLQYELANTGLRHRWLHHQIERPDKTLRQVGRRRATDMTTAPYGQAQMLGRRAFQRSTNRLLFHYVIPLA